jgi:toxin ParE1/3/4
LAILWSPEAEEDLFEIWTYVAREASDAIADSQLRTIHKACGTIEAWPGAGRTRQELSPGIRSFAVSPHVIFYEVAAEQIAIVRILHGRRDADVIFAEAFPS